MSSEPSSSGNASPQGPHRPSQKNDLKDGDLSELPLHIQAVREGLLDFEHFLGLQAAMLVATGDNDQDLIPLLAYKPDGETESQQAREKKFAESALALVKGAKDIKIGGELKGFIRKWMKERVDSAQDGSSMSQKSLAYAGWRLWKAQETLEKDIPPRTSPALYLGFPMYDSNTFQGFYKDPSFNNYTQANLEKVSKHGLQCVPLEYYSFEAPTVCFPWAVLYVFGTTAGSDSSLEDSSSQSIVSRIAAAASTALSIFEGLARFADEKQDGRHIPPVIAITLAGTKTTVWLAYCEIVDERLRDHKMINIWEGNITKIWDSIQFSRIIDNLLFWAQRCLKPMVTKYLDQWRLRYCPSIPNVYSQLEKDTDMAQLVHRIQDRLSSLCISPNEDLPALIRQSIIFQEVMRPSDNEPKEGSDLEGATIYSSSDTASPTNLNESPLKAAPSGSIKVATGRPDSIPGVPIPSMASGKPENVF
ncbi:hypothetical protein N431DRAFT_16769 [Stipitochalara longipes BDJ]|nr:hypothetical protein N431DRAFT_16769 [Stipitochalara longipes BDJ]